MKLSKSEPVLGSFGPWLCVEWSWAVTLGEDEMFKSLAGFSSTAWVVSGLSG